jgi:hypothetical protein
MGRTYKRNDLHNSRRPKSIREKRQYSTNKQSLYNDTDSTEFSTGKYQPKQQQFDPSDYE